MTFLRGVVVDIEEDTVMVLTPDFDLVTVEKNGQTFEVGEEVAFFRQIVPKPVYWNWKRTLAYASGLTAVLLICFITMFSSLSHPGNRVDVAKQQKQLPRSVRFPTAPVATTEHPAPITQAKPEGTKSTPDKKSNNTSNYPMPRDTVHIAPTSDTKQTSDSPQPKMKEIPKPKTKEQLPRKRKKTSPPKAQEPTPSPIQQQPDIPPASDGSSSDTPPRSTPIPTPETPVVSASSVLNTILEAPKTLLKPLLQAPTQKNLPPVPTKPVMSMSEKKSPAQSAPAPALYKTERLPELELPDVEKVAKSEESKETQELEMQEEQGLMK